VRPWHACPLLAAIAQPTSAPDNGVSLFDVNDIGSTGSVSGAHQGDSLCIPFTGDSDEGETVFRSCFFH